MYETSAALSGGMSGGPTVSLDGRVVGVNSFKITGEEQAFNYLAPSSNLAELLTRNGAKPELGSIDVTFRQGLDDYFAGRYTTAITSFDKVLALSPTHGQAQEYKTKAAQAREQYGDATAPSAVANGGSLVLGLVVIGGIMLLGVAAVVVLVLVLRGRRRRGTASGPGAFPPPGPYVGQPGVHQPNLATMPMNGHGYQSAATTLDGPAPPAPAPMSPAPMSPAPMSPAPMSAAPLSAAPLSRPPLAPATAVTGAAPPAGGSPAGESTLRVVEPAPAAERSPVAQQPGGCARCGLAAVPGARFCPQCGGPLAG